MDIIELLRSNAKKDMELRLTLKDGNYLFGQIKDIGDESIILQSNDALSAANFSAVVAWQLNYSYSSQKQPEINVTKSKNEIENRIKDEQVPQKSSIKNGILAAFNPEKAEHKPLNIKPHINKAPSILNNVDNSPDKKKWDSIMSRYQNAIKNENLILIEHLADEMIQLANKYQKSDIFYYNAGAFKLKACNYPDAGQLFTFALKINRETDYAYNAACAYLKGGDYSSALSCLGAYFCLKGEIADENMWLRFCHIAQDLQGYGVFKTVFRDLIGKNCIVDSEDYENLKLLIKSAFYVLGKFEEIESMLSDLYTSIDRENIEATEEILDKFIEEFDHFTIENESFKTSSGFDWIYALLEEPFENLQVEEASNKPANKIYSSDELPIITPANNPRSILQKGSIYRTIPPNRYGFLFDEHAKSCHFKYEAIFDNVGYLDSVSMDNPFPVFFISKPSDFVGASTDETAIFICSYDFLDNMIELATNFSKERNYPNALLELENVLAYDPENKKAQGLKQRWTKIYNDKYKESEEKFSLNPETEAEWEAKGNTMLELGMYEEAIEAFTKASADSSSSSAALYGRGLAHLKMLQYEDALVYLEKALEKNPLHYYAISAKGDIYLRMGEYKNSIQCFDEVISLRPDYISAWKGKAFALFRLAEYDNAIKAYDIILTFEPENWIEMSRKCSVLIKQKKYTMAMQCIDDVLAHIPNDPDMLFIKGYIYQIQGLHTNALHYFDKCIDLDSENIKAFTKKAYVLAQVGRINDALDEVEKAMRLNMNNAKTWYYKGVVYQYAEEFEEAIASYDQSLELEPGVQRVITCRERALQKLIPLKELTENKENEIPQTSGNIEDMISEINNKYSLS